MTKIFVIFCPPIFVTKVAPKNPCAIFKIYLSVWPLARSHRLPLHAHNNNRFARSSNYGFFVAHAADLVAALGLKCHPRPWCLFHPFFFIHKDLRGNQTLPKFSPPKFWRNISYVTWKCAAALKSLKKIFKSGHIFSRNSYKLWELDFWWKWLENMTEYWQQGWRVGPEEGAAGHFSWHVTLVCQAVYICPFVS